MSLPTLEQLKNRTVPPNQTLAPALDLRLLIEAVQFHCVKSRTSPVRYLELDGDKPWVFVPGVLRPSLFSRCPRHHVYKAVRAKKVDPGWDAKAQWWFDRGHVFGAWILAYFRAATQIPELGITDLQDEVVIFDDETQIGGKLDIAFSYGGHRYLVEVKSKDDWADTVKLGAPEPDHLEQLNTYMAATGVHQGFVLYVGSPQTFKDANGQPRFEAGVVSFFHRFDRALWLQKTKQTAAFLLRCVTGNKLPDKLVSRDCERCEYAQHCEEDRLPLRAKVTELQPEPAQSHRQFEL